MALPVIHEPRTAGERAQPARKIPPLRDAAQPMMQKHQHRPGAIAFDFFDMKGQKANYNQALVDPSFLNRAVALALENVRSGNGGPFGAVIVKDGRIIAEGANSVIPTLDPTAHAEVVAIRRACEALGAFHIPGCELYTSCEPCPMCLGAVYWAHIDRVYFAVTKAEAAKAEFDDDFIYREIALDPAARSIPMIHVPSGDAAMEPFRAWLANNERIRY